MKQPSPYFSTTLDNGVQVMAESFPTVQSVSIGFFFKSGVLYENPRQLGVSHFIEHMLFKGTTKRTAKDIARQFDRIGGYLNAFTAKDYCCFYARVVRDKLPVAVEILADMVRDSQFDPSEFERERRVILEEIKMYEDSPDEIIHELLGQNLWRNASLGRPILGTSQTVGALDRDEVTDIYHSQFTTGNLLVCAAGNLDGHALVRLLEKHLKNQRPGSFPTRRFRPVPTFETTVYQKDIEQVHLTLGTPAMSYGDPDRYAVTLLNTAFGGGMSSRLFQEIREKRGLAYAVYSYHTSFRDTGLFSIYAGTSLEHLGRVLELIHFELERTRDKGLTRVELAEAKEQLKGNLLIALESTTNRMNRLATGFLYDVAPLTPEETIRPFLGVTADQIRAVAARLLDERRLAMTIISPRGDVARILDRCPFTARPRTLNVTTPKVVPAVHGEPPAGPSPVEKRRTARKPAAPAGPATRKSRK
ncbi:MAG: insulinase family protein [Candidatus Riflebacteria bacterium]|nr:insulinase family protein [Candidatus Riflebacteria bacterium]